jgi:N-carbamoyl-L-amino-acid hydrolase
VIALEELNRLAPESFAQTLAGIFEHSPWVAQRAAICRPFGSRLQLLEAMRSVVNSAGSEEQLALINAHPKLGTRGRNRQQLTQASSREQKRAGLDACSDEEFAQLEGINAAYVEKFGFPFILAVRGHDPPSIIAHMQRRLRHDSAQEVHAALHEIGLIAAYRLADLVSSRAALEAGAMMQRLPQSRAAPVMTEWMRAAGLVVCSVERDQLIGVSAGASAESASLVIGLHYDPTSQSLIYDGQLGWVVGIAIAQQLKEQGTHLRRDLAVFALPNDHTVGGNSGFGDLDARTGCIAMTTIETIDATRGANRDLLAALRAAGLSRCHFPIARGRAEATRDIERAVGALQEFLLHTQCTADANG